LVMFIASAIDRGTRFTTNSRVSKTLAAVSLSRLSGWQYCNHHDRWIVTYPEQTAVPH
jgi:hypothetical protein